MKDMKKVLNELYIVKGDNLERLYHVKLQQNSIWGKKKAMQRVESWVFYGGSKNKTVLQVPPLLDSQGCRTGSPTLADLKLHKYLLSFPEGRSLNFYLHDSAMLLHDSAMLLPKDPPFCLPASRVLESLDLWKYDIIHHVTFTLGWWPLFFYKNSRHCILSDPKYDMFSSPYP